MSVRYRLSTGPGSWPAPFTGVLDLGAPATTNYGGGEVGFHYPVSGSFAVAGITYTIAGTVLVHDGLAGNQRGQPFFGWYIGRGGVFFLHAGHGAWVLSTLRF